MARFKKSNHAGTDTNTPLDAQPRQDQALGHGDRTIGLRGHAASIAPGTTIASVKGFGRPLVSPFSDAVRFVEDDIQARAEGNLRRARIVESTASGLSGANADPAPQRGAIDLDFRPSTYWPIDVEKHLLSRVKGGLRRGTLKTRLLEGRYDEIPDLLVNPDLPLTKREALVTMHPVPLSGEYLPDLIGDEVEIARISVPSAAWDVVSVYARRSDGRFHYRVVDEYNGETLSEPFERTSARPLTLRQLSSFLDGAWSIFECLQFFIENGNRQQETLDFCYPNSQFYPDFAKSYRDRVTKWAETTR